MRLTGALMFEQERNPDLIELFRKGHRILGFRVAMEEDGLLMLVSPSEPTTQVILPA